MRIVSIFKIDNHQAVRLPSSMAYEGIKELEITREGDVTTLRPVRPSWLSLADLPMADEDYLEERQAIAGQKYQDQLRKKLRGSVIEYVEPFKTVDDDF